MGVGGIPTLHLGNGGEDVGSEPGGGGGRHIPDAVPVGQMGGLGAFENSTATVLLICDHPPPDFQSLASPGACVSWS